jgi:hypothetical protein
MKAIPAALLSLAISCGAPVRAAPVPTHLFPKSAEVVKPGLIFTWDGNPTVWRVNRVEGNTAYIQCADNSGDVYTRPLEEIRKTRHHKFTPTIP